MKPSVEQQQSIKLIINSPDQYDKSVQVPVSIKILIIPLTLRLLLWW